MCNETITGRFVSLHLNNEGILTICELQVEGRQISQTKIEGLIFTGCCDLILQIQMKIRILEPTRNTSPCHKTNFIVCLNLDTSDAHNTIFGDIKQKLIRFREGE